MAEDNGERQEDRRRYPHTAQINPFGELRPKLGQVGHPRTPDQREDRGRQEDQRKTDENGDERIRNAIAAAADKGVDLVHQPLQHDQHRDQHERKERRLHQRLRRLEISDRRKDRRQDGEDDHGLRGKAQQAAAIAFARAFFGAAPGMGHQKPRNPDEKKRCDDHHREQHDIGRSLGPFGIFRHRVQEVECRNHHAERGAVEAARATLLIVEAGQRRAQLDRREDPHRKPPRQQVDEHRPQQRRQEERAAHAHKTRHVGRFDQRKCTEKRQDQRAQRDHVSRHPTPRTGNPVIVFAKHVTHQPLGPPTAARNQDDANGRQDQETGQILLGLGPLFRVVPCADNLVPDDVKGGVKALRPRDPMRGVERRWPEIQKLFGLALTNDAVNARNHAVSAGIGKFGPFHRRLKLRQPCVKLLALRGNVLGFGAILGRGTNRVQLRPHRGNGSAICLLRIQKLLPPVHDFVAELFKGGIRRALGFDCALREGRDIIPIGVVRRRVRRLRGDGAS